VADAAATLTAALSVLHNEAAKVEITVAPRNKRKLTEVLLFLRTPFWDTITRIVLLVDCGVIVAVRPVSA
jgi:hypothetical protein